MIDIEKSVSIPIKELKKTVTSGKSTLLTWRLEQIKRIDKLIDENRSEIIKCLYLDLGKSKIESLSEILLIKEEIALVKRKLKSWIKPKRIKTPIYLFPSFSKVITEPLGCVLLLGPYNYPLLYIFKPLVNIFSAGNTAVIKPSEKCINISKLIKKLTALYFPNNILFVVEGNYKKSEKLASQDFDHIFFTGSSTTGRTIMKLAAKNLTPLTLELSGTNPVIVIKNANLKIAAKRIVWGKFFNSGQSCMAPNHVFVEKTVENKLIEEIKKSIIDFYGKNPLESENLSKLEKSQFLKTLELLKESRNTQKVIFGGQHSIKKSKISPTLLKIKNEKDILIQEEIFSSLLPIMPIKNLAEALEIIQNNSKPLALYIFGGNKNIHDDICKVTSSGSICINDVMLPVLIPNLPFGGVGLSGMGKFHGEEGFLNFSNQKSVTFKSNFFDISLRYPPYKSFLKIIKFFLKI